MYIIKTNKGYYSINMKTGSPQYIDNINFAYGYDEKEEAERIIRMMNIENAEVIKL